MDRVAVNVHIYHYSKTTMPTLPPVWSTAAEAKFNIFEAVSEAAHRMRGLEYHPEPYVPVKHVVERKMPGSIR